MLLLHGTACRRLFSQSLQQKRASGVADVHQKTDQRLRRDVCCSYSVAAVPAGMRRTVRAVLLVHAPAFRARQSLTRHGSSDRLKVNSHPHVLALQSPSPSNVDVSTTWLVLQIGGSFSWVSLLQDPCYLRFHIGAPGFWKLKVSRMQHSRARNVYIMWLWLASRGEAGYALPGGTLRPGESEKDGCRAKSTVLRLAMGTTIDTKPQTWATQLRLNRKMRRFIFNSDPSMATLPEPLKRGPRSWLQGSDQADCQGLRVEDRRLTFGLVANQAEMSLLLCRDSPWPPANASKLTTRLELRGGVPALTAQPILTCAEPSISTVATQSPGPVCPSWLALPD